MTKLPKSVDESPVFATHPLEHVHSDVCGPINPTSREGYRYIINFVDEYSSMLFIYFLRSKEETPSALKKFLADTAPIGTVKELHSDNGLEYMSKAFQKNIADDILNPATGKVVTSRNVHIQQPTFDKIPVPEVTLKPKHESQEDETVTKQPSTNNSTQKIEAESHQQDEESWLSQNSSRRDIRPPKYLADYYLNTSVDYAYSLVLSIP
eukprot:gene20928-22982_t